MTPSKLAYLTLACLGGVLIGTVLGARFAYQLIMQREPAYPGTSGWRDIENVDSV